MPQYKTGTVTVAGESQIIVGSGTQFLTNVAVGDLFKKQGQNVFYEVASVDSDSQLQISSKYVGSGESGVSYAITRDFTPNIALPEISAGDKDWPFSLTRALRLIDTVVAGTALSIKEACRVATVAALSATYSAAAKTLTSTATEACVIDGVTLAINDRVLVKDQTPATVNGVYYVTSAGSASLQWVLARATDCDSSTDILSGMRMMVTEGTVNKGSEWTLTTADPITLDSSTLTFECLGIAGSSNAPMTTSTDPAVSAATTTAIVDAYSGVVITLTTTGNAQTIANPTSTRPGKVFTVINNDTSTNTIAVNGITLPVGKSQSWIWDGTVWSQIDLGITTIPVPVNQGGTGLSTYVVGDLLYASGATTLAKLADVAVGSVLVSKGVGVAPEYSSAPVVTTMYATTFDTNVAAAGVTLAGTTLSADGTDADINISITPKGTGSVVISKVDINAGTIDGTDITVGSGKTLNVSAGTLTLADNQISGDKVEGGTIAAITITALTATTVNKLTLTTPATGATITMTDGKTLSVTDNLTFNTASVGALRVATAANTVGNLAVGLTTQILVGGGASALPVWTTATGSGAPVRATSPTLVTPVLGTPASGDLKNCSAATDALKGVVELATNDETAAGTSTSLVVTPDDLAWRLKTECVQKVEDLSYLPSITFTWDPGSLGDGVGETSAAVPYPGATLGGVAVQAIAPYDLQGITCNAYVDAANSCKVRLQNESGGTINLASGTWTLQARRI